MSLNTFGDRVVAGLLIGLTAFGFVALGALQFGVDVPALALPLMIAMCLAATFGLQKRGAFAVPQGPDAPIAAAPRNDRGGWGPRVVAASLGVVSITAVAMVAYGSLATPSRHWDGAVAWDVKAHHLADAPTLDQPFFRDPHVLVHSRGYPLLQPLVMAAGDRLLGAGGGRVLFPVLYAGLALLIAVGLRRAGVTGTVAWLTAAGCVLAPRLANPTSGGADSGYADLFLLVATTALAVGLLVKDARFLATGAALAVMVKPEGMVYAGLAVAVAWCAGERRSTRWVTLGWFAGAVAWLPVQGQLLRLDDSGALGLRLLPLAVGAAVLGADHMARSLRLDVRARVLAIALFAAVLTVALPLLVGAAAPGLLGALSEYLEDPGRAIRRLQRVPSIVVGALGYAMPPGSFALAFAAPLVAGAALLLQRRRVAAGAVTAFVAGGIAAVLGAFVLSPEEDLDHHLRSSMSRLLLHWMGPAMLLAGAWSDALWRPVGARLVPQDVEAP